MLVSVRIFGPLAEQLGSDAVTVEVHGERVTAREILRVLEHDHPKIGPALGSARLAVNHRFAELATTVGSDDEVAVIALVGGG